ncbi:MULTISPECIES: alpha/beta fold hydrolase [unclassified Kaistella]|uniref:alpha/beta fold hydrolase n=1 Tax=unclassified Kaistella TaxID=2762626 RepID=UPI002732590E|nr:MULTISPECIES: alpha/beta hydrolase [unclassified Kaistella]MDP2454742.1 alpha/beta hydrolase [Kaistella sp. SH11-4b]MDP2457479.1 alpha/beta hydrolase [Kaistella sp. SH40-3]MDP2460239.1 alpha/beta hydrolase [Kaistella sp. SH19-2b]
MALTTINGIDIDYADIGKGDVVVMLHGLGSTKKDWDLQIPVLSQKFRVIAPDFRAHGNSERVPKEQGVEIMTEDVFQLLNSLNIKKASFVGFSMGGAVCFNMAYSHPEMVDKLVIVNSGPDFNNAKDSGVDILAERTKIIKEQGFTSLAETISKGMFPEENQQQWRKEFLQRIIDNDEDAYLYTFGSLMKWGLDDKVSELKNPTLVIASDMDYTSVDYKKAYVNKMQNAKLVVIENSRHGVVVDQAEKLNRELLKFL